jgi:ABC-type bacteriocin/lantibiotic exporter with double-glycine peptidase domain
MNQNTHAIIHQPFTPAEWQQKYASQTPQRQRLLNILLEALGWRGDSRSFLDGASNAPLEQTEWLIASMAHFGYAAHHCNIHHGMSEAVTPPCIVHISGKYPLILLENMGKEWLCYDAALDVQRMVPVSLIQGPGYSFHRRTGYKLAGRDDPKRWLVEIASRYRKLLVHLGLLSLIISFAALATPWLVMIAYDQMLGAHSGESWLWLATGGIGMLVLENWLRRKRARLLTGFAGSVGNHASMGMMEHLLHLPPAVAEGIPPSQQLARLRGVDTLREGLSGPLVLNIMDTPFLFAIIGMMSIIAGPLTLVPIAFMVVGLLSIWLARAPLRHAIRASAHSNAERQRFITEALRKKELIQAAGLQDSWNQRFEAVSRRASHDGMKVLKLHARHEGTIRLMGGLTMVLMMSLGVGMVAQDTLTPGALVASMILSWRMMMPLQGLLAMIPQMETLSGAVDELGRLLSAPLECQPGARQPLARNIAGRVTLRNVAARHNNRVEEVYAGLNASIHAGSIVAITGGNGTGKSTLLKQLAGMLPSSNGSIRIDGIDIRQFDPITLRRSICYLPQQPAIFSGTIMDNMLLTDPDATEAELSAAFERADAWHDIQSLPMGLMTETGNGGSKLPSSLIWRIALARVYLSPSRLMLMDELPPALLNSSTGERLREYIHESKGKRTIIFVTHRSSDMELADHAILLQQEKTPLFDTSLTIAALEKNLCA